MEYILKDGTKVNSIPIGRSPMRIGETFNYLTILDRGENTNLNNRKALCICKCKCGNIVLIPYSNLKSGHTKSCGCYNKEIHKEICKKIGQQSYSKDYTKVDNPFYNFIKPTEDKDNANSFFWVVECKKCNQQYKVVPSQLISYKRQRGNNPCHCWQHISKGVLKIIQILKANNISYELEKSFSTCLSPKNKPLKFDLYVNNSYLIEFDGEQHFLPTNFGSKTQTGEQRLTKQKKYDKIKNNWCINNNIPLIRIPYTHYNNITINDLLIETSNFIIKENNNE